MPEVVSYVKNQGLQFTIPYTMNGDERQYVPDFIVRVHANGRDLTVHGHEDVRRGGPSASAKASAERSGPPIVNLIVEVSGEARKDKAAKVATARTLSVPAVNNHGGFGRWAFVEVTDPWDAKNAIRAALREAAPGTVVL